MFHLFLCLDSHGPRGAGGARPTGRYIDYYSPPAYPGGGRVRGGQSYQEERPRMTPPPPSAREMRACPNKTTTENQNGQQPTAVLFDDAVAVTAVVAVFVACVAVRHRPVGSWARFVGCAPSRGRLRWRAASAARSERLSRPPPVLRAPPLPTAGTRVDNAAPSSGSWARPCLRGLAL